MIERVLSMYELTGIKCPDPASLFFVFFGNEGLLVPKRLHEGLSC